MKDVVIIKIEKDGEILPFRWFTKTGLVMVTFSQMKTSEEHGITTLDGFKAFIQMVLKEVIKETEWNYIFARIESGGGIFSIGTDRKVKRMIDAIKINPKMRTVDSIDIDEQQIERSVAIEIGCRMLDHEKYVANHILYYDEEGAIKEEVFGFSLPDFNDGEQIVGNAMIVKRETGKFVDSTLDIEWIRSKIEWIESKDIEGPSIISFN